MRSGFWLRYLHFNMCPFVFWRFVLVLTSAVGFACFRLPVNRGLILWCALPTFGAHFHLVPSSVSHPHHNNAVAFASKYNKKKVRHWMWRLRMCASACVRACVYMLFLLFDIGKAPCHGIVILYMYIYRICYTGL